MTVRSERTEVELNDDLLDRGSMYWGAMARVLGGSDFDLPRDFIPSDLQRPHAVF